MSKRWYIDTNAFSIDSIKYILGRLCIYQSIFQGREISFHKKGSIILIGNIVEHIGCIGKSFKGIKTCRTRFYQRLKTQTSYLMTNIRKSLLYVRYPGQIWYLEISITNIYEVSKVHKNCGRSCYQENIGHRCQSPKKYRRWYFMECKLK